MVFFPPTSSVHRFSAPPSSLISRPTPARAVHLGNNDWPDSLPKIRVMLVEPNDIFRQKMIDELQKYEGCVVQAYDCFEDARGAFFAEKDKPHVVVVSQHLDRNRKRFILPGMETFPGTRLVKEMIHDAHFDPARIILYRERSAADQVRDQLEKIPSKDGCRSPGSKIQVVDRREADIKLPFSGMHEHLQLLCLVEEFFKRAKECPRYYTGSLPTNEGAVNINGMQMRALREKGPILTLTPTGKSPLYLTRSGKIDFIHVVAHPNPHGFQYPSPGQTHDIVRVLKSVLIGVDHSRRGILPS